ncbi:hypothetical protein GIB67_028034 [Kingdonia uniflora]|uniref:DUF4283 domain-containing protein n=1 Tax=Kingdonia uniflora TaxID=39325 RepID=A0A7J7NE70_9MAGN|nr:hypothetical protein GIB67_028034 [Kingdonia uniflora]
MLCQGFSLRFCNWCYQVGGVGGGRVRVYIQVGYLLGLGAVGVGGGLETDHSVGEWGIVDIEDEDEKAGWASRDLVEGRRLIIHEDGVKRGVERFKFSLIGRLDLMKTKLAIARDVAMSLWKLKGTCQFIPLGKVFFTFLLDNEEDKFQIWWGGPWHIESQLLRVIPWVPNFDVLKQKNSNAMVWIKFPGLPNEYWEEDILMSMARTIGNPVQVDGSTLRRNTGLYASVLVDIDFSLPVPTKIFVENDKYEFVQEVILGRTPKVCSHCKVVGHIVSECRDVRKEIHVENVTTKAGEDGKKKMKNNRNKKKDEQREEQDKAGDK